MLSDPFAEAERVLREWNVETAVNQALDANAIEQIQAQTQALTHLMFQTWRVLQDYRDRLQALDGRTFDDSVY